MAERHRRARDLPVSGEDLRSGEVAAAAGVHLETLRYYERRGLISEPRRTIGGHRLYPAKTVQLVRFIKAAQRLGFTLAEVTDLVQVRRRSGAGQRDIELRAARKLAETKQKIADLCAIRDILRVAAAGGCEDPVAYLEKSDVPLGRAGMADPVSSSGRSPMPRRFGARGAAAVAWNSSVPLANMVGDSTVVTISMEDPVAVASTNAIHDGDLALLRRLLAENSWLAKARLGHDGPDETSRTLLHVVTDWPGHFPNGPAIVGLLVGAGADVNARFHGSHEETPLHWAASSDDVDVLDALLDAGADIESPGGVIGNGTPLHDATAFGQWNAAHRLVERGAKPTSFDAAALGLMDHLRARFGGGGPDTELVSDAFWAACHGGRRDAAEYLLDRGAELNWVPGWDRLTPLDAAARSEATALVEWLRERGAKTFDEGTTSLGRRH